MLPPSHLVETGETVHLFSQSIIYITNDDGQL